MIDDHFRNFLQDELDHRVYSYKDLQAALIDRDDADMIWSDFHGWHRDACIECVRTHIKAIMKNGRKLTDTAT